MRTTTIAAHYREAAERHNGSPLATEHGYFHELNAYTLRQAELIVSCMPPSGHFLDVGTGSCMVPRVIKKLGYRVSTVDSPDASETAALENAKSLGIETISAHVGRDRLPLQDAAVDVVGAFDVIEHIPDSPRPFLAELRRVLKPGGRLIIGTPNAVRLTARIKVALGYSNWPAVADYIDQEKNWGHHHEYTRDELRQTLEMCGYRVVANEMMEIRLGRVRIAKFSEIRTQVRNAQPGRALPPITVATSVLKLWTSIAPSLRSAMLFVATPA